MADTTEVRARWWKVHTALRNAQAAVDHDYTMAPDMAMLTRMSQMDAEVLAAAPSSPGEDPDWPGGWVLVNEHDQQVSGHGLTTAWPTQQAAEAAATMLATPVRAKWSPVSSWADFQVLDRRYWDQAAAGAR